MLDYQQKLEIYNILKLRFCFGQTYPMAQVAKHLTDNGLSSIDFGFSKMKSLFLNLTEYLTITDVIDSGQPQCEVCFREWIGDEPSETVTKNELIFLPDNIKELAAYPSRTMAALAANAEGVSDADEAEAAVSAAYGRSRRENGFVIKSDRIVFDSGLAANGGIPIDIILTRNKFIGAQPWWLSFARRGEQVRSDAAPANEAAQVRKQLTDSVKKEIYRLFMQKFPADEPLHMATVSKLMLDEGYDRATYGYAKMKNMLGELSSFLEMEETIMGGVPQTLITVRRVKQWDDEPAATKSTQKPEAAAAPAAVQPAAKPTDDLPPGLKDNLTDFAFLPPKTLDILREYAGGAEGAADIDLKEVLCRAYDRARKEGGLRVSEGRVFFETGLCDSSGNSIEVSLKHSDYQRGLPWVLNYIGIRKKFVPGAQQRRDTPGRMLERFAFLGSWIGFLSALAGKALPEAWNFADGTRKDYFILQKYIQYTFYRLQLEDKICISEDNEFAAFNTGLVDEHYDDIYACFTSNRSAEAGQAAWRFTEFCTAAARGTGKRLVDCFNPLPQPPSYFEKKEDLLYDLEKELLADFQHIIIDNVKRLPIGFLIEEFHGVPKALQLAETAGRETDRLQRARIMKELGEMLEDDHKLFNRLRNRIQDAIDLALKQVRWNFKTAIPCYFPKRNSMSLMLPLCLEDDGRADTALVVELMRSGNYQGQTILTLQQAYVDARLLCRPNSEWLKTNEIKGDDDKDDDEDI